MPALRCPDCSAAMELVTEHPQRNTNTDYHCLECDRIWSRIRKYDNKVKQAEKAITEPDKIVTPPWRMR